MTREELELVELQLLSSLWADVLGGDDDQDQDQDDPTE